MKKVLIVITTEAAEYGGLTTVMLNYYTNMSREGFVFDFLSTNRITDRLRQKLAENGSGYIQLPSRKRSPVHYMLGLFKLLKLNEYDIIHVNGNSATMAIELNVAKMAGIPDRIAHGHTTQSNYPLFDKMMTPFFKGSYTKALAVSKDAGEWLYKGEKYIVLNNAVSTERFKYNGSIRDEYRSKLGISNKLVIGNIGRLNFPKNQRFLIDVFREYRKYDDNSVLLLVGEGKERSLLEQKIGDYGLKEDVFLLGARRDNAELLQAMDVFIFPSIFEGFGLALVEAQAAGLFCICSENVPEEARISDYVKSISLKQTSLQWADELYHISSDLPKTKREERSQKARAMITAKGYNIEMEADRLRKIYCSCTVK